MPSNTTTTRTSLCANCLHQGNCVFEKQATGPVLHCEMHAVLSVPEAPARPQTKVIPAVAGKGLCGTCDHRDHCALRTPDRIVLHCEHYQ